MQGGDVQSPQSLHTCIWPSEYGMQNRNSEKTTLCHSCIQLCQSMHHSTCLSLYCIVKGSQSNGRWADRLCYWKCQYTIRVEIEHSANIPNSWFMAHDVVICFCKVDLTMCVSSPVLVKGENWDLACYLVWLSVTHWFHIHITVDGCRPVWWAISRNINQHFE